MSEHTIYAVGDDGDSIEVVFSYTPGSADYWNRHIGTWEQGYGPEVDLVRCWNADSNRACTAAEEAFVVDWLQGEGRADAIEAAHEDHEAAREFAAELRRDR